MTFNKNLMPNRARNQALAGAAKPAPVPAKASQPETPAQKAENATVLGRILKENGIDPATAATILAQFKAQDQ